jgi:hypothetical protein
MLRIFEKIKFLFSKPKYQLYTHVWIWNDWYFIVEIEKNWDWCDYYYTFENGQHQISEGVIDYYKQSEPNEIERIYGK